MTGERPWDVANQQYLAASLARLRMLLARHAGIEETGEDLQPEAVSTQLAEAEAALPYPSALDAVAERFGLGAFERDVLLLCAGCELDAGMAALVAAVQGDRQRRQPSFGLALAALPGAHWSAITPAAALRRWRLVEPGAGGPTQAPLAIDERILHYLLGISEPDRRLEAFARPAGTVPPLPPSHRDLAERIAAAWDAPPRDGRPLLVELDGPDATEKREVAVAAAQSAGLGALLVRAGDIPADTAERSTLRCLLEREALLDGTVLVIETDDWEAPEQQRGLPPFLEALGPVRAVVLGRDRLRLSRPTLRLDVGRPTSAEQRDLWHRTLGMRARGLDDGIDAVLMQFDLGRNEIEAAGSALAEEDGTAARDALWELCRAQSRPRLEELAQRIEPAATWDDLVLPERQKDTLRQIASQLRARHKVYRDWGFARRTSRGLGIAALFAGSSGTGKTMAAEVLARELRLDLFRIDLSAVVSKYIGETEKNLRRVFDAAEVGGAILLFDEADALFGKRSEVKDSHDRYANIEVGYLLQRMESYRGLAVLTTNHKQALDTAFLRRLRFVVQFPFPDAAQRTEIWRRAFPPEADTGRLDFGRLARLSVPGGNIRNIALNAAFLAADRDEAIGMGHLLQAAFAEYGKLEKPLTDAETEGWL
jgi:AAA+ superfamily predicted ATPase